MTNMTRREVFTKFIIQLREQLKEIQKEILKTMRQGGKPDGSLVQALGESYMSIQLILHKISQYSSEELDQEFTDSDLE